MNEDLKFFLGLIIAVGFTIALIILAALLFPPLVRWLS